MVTHINAGSQWGYKRVKLDINKNKAYINLILLLPRFSASVQ